MATDLPTVTVTAARPVTPANYAISNLRAKLGVLVRPNNFL